MTMEKKPHIDEAALDEALAKVQILEPSDQLARRIMVDAEETLGKNPFKTFWPFGKIWQPVTIMAAAMVLGVWVGLDAVKIDNADLNDEIETMLMG